MSKFLKHEKGFFDQLIIKKLRSLPNGSDCVIVYQKLLELTLDTEGVIEFSGLEATFEEEIALIIDEKLETVKSVLATLLKFDNIKKINDSSFMLTQFEQLTQTNKSEYMRNYMRKYRCKTNCKANSKVNVNFTKANSKTNVSFTEANNLEPEPQKTPDTSEVQGFVQTVIPEVSSISPACARSCKDLNKDLLESNKDLKDLKSKNLKPKTLKPKNLCARTRTRVDKNPTRDINLLEISKNVIGRLNQVAGTTFRHTTPSTLKNIKQILNADYTQDDFFTVIDKMGHLWTVVSPEMHGYLRPSTLFRSPSKFDEYLNLVPGRKLTRSQKVALESMQNIAEIARVTDALEKSGLKFAPDNSEHRPNDLSDFEDFFKNSFNQESGIAC